MCPSTGQPPYIRRAQARRNQRQHAPSPRKPASNAASRLWMRRLYTFPKDVFPNALHLLTPRMIGFVLPGCGCLIARITVCSIPRPKRLCAAEVFSAVSGSGASIFFEAGARAGVGANSLTAGAPSESDAVSEFCEEGTGFLCDYSLQGCPSVRQRQADSVAVPPRGRHVRSAGNLTRRIGNRHLQERGNGCGRMRRCALTPSCDSKSLPVNHGDLFRRETPPLGSLVTVAADEVQMACSALPDYSWMVAGLWPRGIGLWCVGRPRIRVTARNLCDDRGVARALFAVHGILLMAAAIGRGRLAREDIVGSWVGVVGLRSPQPEQSCRRFVCMPDWCVAPSRRGAVYVPPRRRSGPDGCTLVVGRRP
jgi:hypothetical protein